eukprot:4387137-Amphidinium_carterae.1
MFALLIPELKVDDTSLPMCLLQARVQNGTAGVEAPCPLLARESLGGADGSIVRHSKIKGRKVWHMLLDGQYKEAPYVIANV